MKTIRVLCDQKNKSCYGSISKEEWTGSNRLGACKREMAKHENKAGTIAVGLNLCDLDNKLNDMCLALQTARQHLIDANCQMTGACSPREFVYTPAMYSTTNSDFARGTVTDFYELHNPLLGAVNSFRLNSSRRVPDVCPMDDLDLELRLRNDEYTQQCASRELERMQYLVRVCRLIVHLIVEGCAYWVNIIMCLMRFIVETTQEGIRSVTVELMFWFNKLWMLITDMLEQIANLMFKVVFENGNF